MKSLLLKDLYVMKGTTITFSIILIAFIAAGVLGNSVFLIMAFAFASIQSVSVFNAGFRSPGRHRCLKNISLF